MPLPEEGIGPLTTDDRPTQIQLGRRCSTESEAWLHDWWIDGTGVGGCMGRRKGRGYKRRYTHPPLRVDPNSRAPAGPGPSPPFVPLRPPSSVQHCLAHPPAPNNLPRRRRTFRYTCLTQTFYCMFPAGGRCHRGRHSLPHPVPTGARTRDTLRMYVSESFFDSLWWGTSPHDTRHTIGPAALHLEPAIHV